jgi:hypothetical protein
MECGVATFERQIQRTLVHENHADRICEESRKIKNGVFGHRGPTKFRPYATSAWRALGPCFSLVCVRNAS